MMIHHRKNPMRIWKVIQNNWVMVKSPLECLLMECRDNFECDINVGRFEPNVYKKPDKWCL